MWHLIRVICRTARKHHSHDARQRREVAPKEPSFGQTSSKKMNEMGSCENARMSVISGNITLRDFAHPWMLECLFSRHSSGHINRKQPRDKVFRIVCYPFPVFWVEFVDALDDFIFDSHWRVVKERWVTDEDHVN